MAISAKQLFSKDLLQSKRKLLIAAVTFIVLAVAVTFVVINLTPGQTSEGLRQHITQLEKTVKADPHDVGSRVSLALAYYQSNQPERAISSLNTALNLNGSHQGALILLGDIYMDQGRYGDAIPNYQKVVDMNPIEKMTFSSRQIEGAYYQLGAAYYNMDNWTGAASILETTLLIDGSDSDALYLLGKSYLKLGEFEKAVESFKKAVRFVPNFKEAYEGMAECFDKLGQEVPARYARAMVAYSSGSTQEAVTQLQNVTAEKPDYTDAFLGLALAYEKAGENENAKAAYEKVLELDPENWLAKAKLGR